MDSLRCTLNQFPVMYLVLVICYSYIKQLLILKKLRVNYSCIFTMDKRLSDQMSDTRYFLVNALVNVDLSIPDVHAVTVI